MSLLSVSVSDKAAGGMAGMSVASLERVPLICSSRVKLKHNTHRFLLVFQSEITAEQKCSNLG